MKKQPKPEAPKVRNVPLNEIELLGLQTLHAQAVEAQQKVTRACELLATAKGEPPAKLRYALSDDGKILNLIDQE